MRCTATVDPTADLAQPQCRNPAVVVGLMHPTVVIDGPVCQEHLEAARAWLHGLGVATVGVSYL